MKGIKGSMNIEFSEKYDQEDDVYYVTFQTGEPSYAVELDDVLLLELGMYTNLPTGFRILNFNKHKVGSVQIMVRKIRKKIAELGKTMRTDLHCRETRIERTLEKVLA